MREGSNKMRSTRARKYTDPHRTTGGLGTAFIPAPLLQGTEITAGWADYKDWWLTLFGTYTVDNLTSRTIVEIVAISEANNEGRLMSQLT